MFAKASNAGRCNVGVVQLDSAGNPITTFGSLQTCPITCDLVTWSCSSNALQCPTQSSAEHAACLNVC
jgi:hypothetical protein